MTITMAKDERIYLRATGSQKSVLAKAAELNGKSISDFVLDAASREAENAILDQRVFYVTEEQYEAFMVRANDLEKNRANLKRALEYKASWEK